MMRKDTQNGTYHKALAAGCIGVTLAVRWSRFLTEFSSWKGLWFCLKIEAQQVWVSMEQRILNFGGFCMQ